MRPKSRARREWEERRERLAEMARYFAELVRETETKGSLIGVNYIALIATVNDAKRCITTHIDLNDQLHRHFGLGMVEGYREMEKMVEELGRWSEKWTAKIEEMLDELLEDGGE